MESFHVIWQATGDWPCSFEEAVTALDGLPRLFIEPDGSFVWRGHSPDREWQLDGSLFDRDGRLCYVELKGECPLLQLGRFLSCLRIEPDAVQVQFVREGELLTWAQFEARVFAH